MKSLFHLAKRFLANRPELRRKVVNAIYRIPALDMRLRAALEQRSDAQWRPIDVDDLPEDVRLVYARLRQRARHR